MSTQTAEYTISDLIDKINAPDISAPEIINLITEAIDSAARFDVAPNTGFVMRIISIVDQLKDVEGDKKIDTDAAHRLFLRAVKAFKDIDVIVEKTRLESLLSYYAIEIPVVALMLIDEGADTTYTDRAGFGIIHKAIISGDLTLVNAALNSQADPTLLAHNKESILHTSCVVGDEEILKRVLEQDVDINAVELTSDLSPIGIISSMHNNPDLLSLLLSHDAKLTATGLYHETPLELCLINGNMRSGKYLINQFASFRDAGDALGISFYDDLAAVLTCAALDVNDQEVEKGKKRTTLIERGFAKFLLSKEFTCEQCVDIATTTGEINTICLIFDTTPMKLLEFDVDETKKSLIRRAIFMS